MGQLPKPHFEWSQGAEWALWNCQILAMESLRLVEIILAARKATDLKFEHLPILETAGEGSLGVAQLPDGSRQLRITLGRDLLHGGVSGHIVIQVTGRRIAAEVHIPEDAEVNLDALSDRCLRPAVEYLLLTVAPVPKDLPPLGADFSYQT